MRLRTIAAATLIVTVTTSLAIACSVPVFRYALEHWHPDPYVVYVFRDGDLTAEQQSVVDSLQPKSETGSSAVNVLVKVADIRDKDDAAAQQIWQDHVSEKLPWMVVLSPPKWGPAQTTWQGELTAEHAAMVVDSPARTQIGKKLINGESVVWVLLECGRKEDDDSAFDTLTAELKKLETKIKLPEIDEEDLKDLSVAPNALKVAFSAIRISRDDPQERALAEMLLRIEPDLLEEPQVSQPMAFPVFGRGRALYALVGKGIAPDVIEEACVFLTGGCQCTVKAQNPGVDLIMNVDWNNLVIPTEIHDEKLPPLAGFADFAAPNEGLDKKVENGDVQPKDALPAGATQVSVAPDEAPAQTITPQVQSQNSDSQNSVTKTSEATGLPVVQELPDSSPATSVNTNVLYVLMSLVVIVVIGTFYFMPRTN